MSRSKITNLIAMPLIASAIFLASPSAFGAGTAHAAQATIRNITNTESIPDTKEGIVGTVISSNGSSLVVMGEDDTEYTVDATHATIMKAFEESANPVIVPASDIHTGDGIVVRGTIQRDEEL